ncbi:MAG: SDR family NAD(P)-dependent oxidoreductase [Acidimicrobiia bacterium]|nr:SDR family NAD(P)-dependent oxidoreductase [Acidimicrobiia bacterium]
MATTRRLDGTVALVTGASSGIGAATARSLAAEGAVVVVAARRKDRLDELVAQVAADGGVAAAVEADVTDRQQAVGLVDGVVTDHGRLDIVVNNAGVMLNGPIEGAPLDEWERMVDLNLKGLLYVAHASVPHLLQAASQDEPRGVADLVNISSVAGRVARLGSGVYNLTKHGVGAFSESLRQEVTERHVRVALVEPGAVATELATHMRDEIVAAMAKRFADVEILQADDIADAITYVVTRPRRMGINEILIRPTEQQA